MKDKSLNQYDYANLFSVIEEADGIQFYNLYNSINISGDIDPTLYDEIYWTDSDDFYTLSHKYYDTTRLWWTILVANNIINPFDDLVEGQRIKILKSSVVSQLVTEINKV